MSSETTYEELGLPVSPSTGGPIELLFNPPSGTVLVTIGESRSPGWPRRIFMRAPGESCYSELQPPGDGDSVFLQALSCESTAEALVVVDSHRSDPRAHHRALYRVALKERSFRAVPDLHAAPEIPPRLWISEMLMVSADGSALYANVAAAPRHDRHQRGRVSYSICRIRTADGFVERLVELPTTCA